MKSVILLLLFVLSVPTVSYSQVDSVTVDRVSFINAKHRVNGIYRTFDEFRRNEPFFTDSFIVIKAGSSADEKAGKRYRDELAFTNENGKDKQQGSQRFFGYCLNDTVHIAFWKFHPIVELGHLSLIRVKEFRPDYQYNNPFPHPGINLQPMPSPPPPRMNFPSRFGPDDSRYNEMDEHMFDRWIDKWFVLDYMTGELESINTMSLLDKFELWDKELYKEFRKNKNRNSESVQRSYVRKFNERQPIRF